MKITTDVYSMKSMFKSCKQFISKDYNREALRFIYVTVTDDKVVAVASDGYRATRVFFEPRESDGSSVSFYLRPFTFEAGVQGCVYVDIELNDKGVVTVSYTTPDGDVCRRFDQPADAFPESIFKVLKECNDEVTSYISFKPANLLAGVSSFDKRFGYVELGYSTDKRPLRMFASDYGFDVEQIVLPVRRADK